MGIIRDMSNVELVMCCGFCIGAVFMCIALMSSDRLGWGPNFDYSLNESMYEFKPGQTVHFKDCNLGKHDIIDINVGFTYYIKNSDGELKLAKEEELHKCDCSNSKCEV